MKQIIKLFLSLVFFIFLPLLFSCSGGSSGSSSSPPVTITATSGKWSDPQTWGGTKPAAGALVVIPAGADVTIDEDPPSLAGVDVNGTLIFARRNTNLRTGWITVNGKLQIGTEAEPFLHRLVITLIGRPGTDPQGREGGIRILSGIADIHGAAGKVPWTRLAETAVSGSNRLVLQAAPGWQAGDRIVIASTDFDMNQAEEKDVTAVSGNVVTLGSPLKYTHWGATESGVDERAEVGLLSRNILIQGDEQSPQAGMGGHLMAMAGSILRVSGVEFFHMGRKAQDGRYPIHFHMMGDATGSYAKENSIHHSFNRAVTIHGSHNTVVQGNVAYDILGHSYFFQDGIETGNLLENNLGLVTRRPAAEFQIVESDSEPSTFWISNPSNIIRGNAAAGADAYGFWYDMPAHPTGLSSTDTIFPRHLPLLEFSGNSAHSNSDDGLFVDSNTTAAVFEPREGGLLNGAALPAVFSDFTVYKNRGRGIWIRGRNLVVQRAKIADNEIGATFALIVLVNSPITVTDSIIVGETANKGNPVAGEVTGVDGRTLPHPSDPGRPIRGFEYYDGLVGVSNTTFVNFQSDIRRKSGALSDFRFNRFLVNPNNYAESLTFVNANPVYFDPLGANSARPDDEDGHRSTVFVDRSGSLTGSAGRSVVVNNPFMVDVACTFISDWNAFISPHTYGSLVLFNEDTLPTVIAPLRIIRDDSGAIQTLAGRPTPTRFTFYTNLIDKRSYTIAFGGLVPKKLRIDYRDRQSGDWIQLAIPYPYPQFTLHRDGNLSTPLTGVNSVAAVAAGSGDVYYNDVTGQKLHVKLLVATGKTSARIDVTP